jgi:hypothetical protein
MQKIEKFLISKIYLIITLYFIKNHYNNQISPFF